jgi:adhesin/invasin
MRIRSSASAYGHWTAIALLAALVACDRVPLTAPSNSTITVTAPTRVLAIGGSTQVTAFVTESAGTPVQNGTTVRFTTTLGRVDPVEAQTQNGFAEVTFFAGEMSGVAEIRATSGAAGGGAAPGTGGGNGGTTGGTATGTNVVTISIGAAAIAQEGGVTLRANPSAVGASGGTVELVATVVGDGGRPLAGIPVTFSATRGSLSSATATTDGNGEARTTLTTSEQTEVTARAGTRVSTAVTITARGVNTVSLNVDPTSPVALQPMTLTITPSIATGNPPPRVRVDWGDGSNQDVGLVAAPRGVTHTYSTPGFYTISVTATTDGDEFTTQQAVQVIAQPTLSVTISASDTTPAVNIPVTFTASVVGTSSGQVTSYQWDILLANGSLESTTTTTSNQLIHTFTSTGNRTVRVRITTADNRTAEGSIPVSVN